MKCRELIAELDRLAPRAYACDWDNPGLLAGRTDKEIKKVMVALDAGGSVVEQAVRGKADFLLTHHPLIFSPLKSVTDEHFVSRRILSLLQADISYFAAHTNFDAAPGCMADLAAERLSMIPEKPLEVMGEEHGVLYGIGKVGTLATPMTIGELGELVKEKFGLPAVSVYGLSMCCRPISRIAVSPGAGSSMVSLAIKEKAEVLITGDIRHHDGLDAVENGLAIVDAGHYGLEHLFVPFFVRYLTERFGGMLEVVSAEESAPSQII